MHPMLFANEYLTKITAKQEILYGFQHPTLAKIPNYFS